MWCIIISLALIIILILVLFFLPKKEVINQNYVKNLTSIMNYHAQSHRNLLLETIGQFKNREQTYQDMIKIVRQLRPFLISKYGLTVSNNIVSLLEEKDQIISVFYTNISKSYCSEGICVKGEIDDKSNKTLDSFISQYAMELMDEVKKELDRLNSKITNLLKFEKELEEEMSKKYEILLSLYDQEVINQAKAYIFKDFENSMNHSRGSYEVSYNLADQLSKIISN